MLAMTATSSSPTAPTTGASKSSREEIGSRIKLAGILNQAKDGEVMELEQAKLDEARLRYWNKKEGDPLPNREVTNDQLSALGRTVEAGKTPYADFGVWGPDGLRREKRLKFEHGYMDTNGVWRTKEIPGPANWDDWCECFEVFRTAAIMLDIASDMTLEIYKSELEKRAKRFQGMWHLVAMADMRCRSEWLEQEHRRQRAFHQEDPKSSAYDPKRPWNSVLRAAATDERFWKENLEDPAIDVRTTSTKRGWGTDVPGVPGEVFKRRRAPKKPKGQGQDGGGYGGGAGGKGGDPNAWKNNVPLDPTSKEAYKKGKGKGQRTQDGRWRIDRDGEQLCYEYGRNHNGCSEGQCKGTPRRSHTCEFCLATHRSITCNYKPKGFVFPSGKGNPGKGAGAPRQW